MALPSGSADVTTYFVMRLAADGTSKTGLTYTSFSLAYCTYRGSSSTGTEVTLTPTGSHTDWGVAEVDATNQPGLYRIDWPDAAFSGSNEVILTASATACFVEHMRVELGAPAVNVVEWNGTAVATPDTAGYPVTTIKDGTGTGEINTLAGAIANVGTVTNLTNLPSIPANWITTAGITDGAFTAEKFAASSLNGKGDWNVGKTGYSLTATTGLGNQTANITGTITTATNVTTVNDKTGYALSAAGVDAIWDETGAGHITAGTFGLYLTTVQAQIGTGGDNLTAIPWNAAWDVEVESEVTDALTAFGCSTVTTAQVNTEVDTALADIHLDHLLAVDYDPAIKPGVATALLNEIIGDDAGVSQFTANALELAPTGGLAPTVQQIWDFDLTGTGVGATLAGNVLADVPSTAEFQARTIVAANYLQPTVAGRTLDVTATGAAGIDFANVEGQGSFVTLTNTTIGTVTVAGTVSGNVNGTVDSVITETKLDALIATVGAAGVGLTAVALADTTSDAVLADAIWNAATVTYGDVGSYGEFVEAIAAGGDATEAKQDTIITHLTDIKGTTWDATNSLESIYDNTGAAGIGLSAIPEPSWASSVADFVTAMWTEDLSTYTGVQAGKTISDILADTADLQANQGQWLTSTLTASGVWGIATASLVGVGSVGSLVVANLNAAVSSRATSTALDAAQTDLDTLTAGVNLTDINGTAILGTGSQVAAAFEYFFNVAAPAKTVNDVGVAGAALTAQEVWDFDISTTGVGVTLAGNVLADVPSTSEFEARTLVSASYATPTNITGGTITTVSGNVDGNVSGVVTLANGPHGGVGASFVLASYNDFQGSAGDPWLTDISSYTGVQAGKTVSDILAGVGTNEGKIDGIKTKTDQFVFTVANQVDSNALSGAGGLDAAGVRSAVGLAAANLDTQLADIPTVAEFEARTLVAASYNTVVPDAAGTAAGLHTTTDALIDVAQVDLDTLTAGVNLTEINGTAILGTGSQIAAAFEYFFNVATPAKTVNDVGVAGVGLTAEEVRIEMDANSTQLIAIVADTNELQLSQGDWATATGFATPTNVTDAQAAIIVEIDANEVKIDGIKTTTDQFIFTNPGEVDANAVTGGGGDDAATIYTYFTDTTNEDVFKADVTGIQSDVTAIIATLGTPVATIAQDIASLGTGGLIVGPGALETIVTVNDIGSGDPVSGVECWVSTDSDGDNVIAGTLVTDSFGVVTFFLDEGNYYLWRKSDVEEFPNPVVLAGGT